MSKIILRTVCEVCIGKFSHPYLSLPCEQHIELVLNLESLRGGSKLEKTSTRGHSVTGVNNFMGEHQERTS